MYLSTVTYIRDEF